MKKNHSYRPVAAFILAALVLQVFVLQGLHHYVGHDHEESVCELTTSHLHAESHGHYSCYICFFHFAPAEVEEEGLVIFISLIHEAKNLSTVQGIVPTSFDRHIFLRGPPALTV